MYDLFYGVCKKGIYQLRMVDNHQVIVAVSTEEKMLNCLSELVSKYKTSLEFVSALYSGEKCRLSTVEIERREKEYDKRDNKLQEVIESTISRTLKMFHRGRTTKDKSTGKKTILVAKEKSTPAPAPLEVPKTPKFKRITLI